MTFTDASVNWEDVIAFLAGFGSVWFGDTREVVLNSDITRAEDNKASDARVPMRIRSLDVGMRDNTWNSGFFTFRGVATAKIPPIVLRRWRKALREWMDANKITLDCRVWPLLSIEPPAPYIRVIWAVCRDNVELAQHLARTGKYRNAVYCNLPFNAELGTDAINRLREEGQTRMLIDDYKRNYFHVPSTS